TCGRRIPQPARRAETPPLSGTRPRPAGDRTHRGSRAPSPRSTAATAAVKGPAPVSAHMRPRRHGSPATCVGRPDPAHQVTPRGAALPRPIAVPVLRPGRTARRVRRGPSHATYLGRVLKESAHYHATANAPEPFVA